MNVLDADRCSSEMPDAETETETETDADADADADGRETATNRDMAAAIGYKLE